MTNLTENLKKHWKGYTLIFIGICVILAFVPVLEETEQNNMESISNFILRVKQPKYRILGFSDVWVEGVENHILKISVTSEWYQLSYNNKKTTLSSIGKAWRNTHTTSAARLEVVDHYSGKKVGYYGAMGAKIY